MGDHGSVVTGSKGLAGSNIPSVGILLEFNTNCFGKVHDKMGKYDDQPTGQTTLVATDSRIGLCKFGRVCQMAHSDSMSPTYSGIHKKFFWR